MRTGEIVFLSASVPTREGWREDARPSEIEEAIVSLARAVFARGGRLLFGGHPSVSYLVASVAGEYYAPDPKRTERPVITFQSEFFREFLPDETWLLYRMGWSSIAWTEKKPTREESLGIMREQMLELPARLMFAIGGMEGVVDEAAKFLEHRPKVYAVPSGGGAAARLIRDDKTGRIVDAERFWADRHRKLNIEGAPFAPYAAIMQYILDREDA